MFKVRFIEKGADEKLFARRLERMLNKCEAEGFDLRIDMVATGALITGRKIGTKVLTEVLNDIAAGARNLSSDTKKFMRDFFEAMPSPQEPVVPSRVVEIVDRLCKKYPMEVLRGVIKEITEEERRHKESMHPTGDGCDLDLIFTTLTKRLIEYVNSSMC